MTAASGATLLSRSYGNDLVGTITSLNDTTPTSLFRVQRLIYDHCDRLMSWSGSSLSETATATATRTPTATPVPPPPTLTEHYAYTRLGNLITKAGASFHYPAAGQPRPHAPLSGGGRSFQYDANGNRVSDGVRTFAWNGWNQLVSVTRDGVHETSTYDATGARVTRTTNGAVVVTVGDRWERTVGGATTHIYRFGADVIGVRRSDQGTWYLHSDQLGSVSAVTRSDGELSGVQHDDPWGAVRSGGIGQTAFNDTGQRLDASGLVYYHARYDDPNIGRFRSADTSIPGSPPFTVWPSAAPAQGMWRSAGSGPATPQDLNRAADALNTPRTSTDPGGHWAETF